MRRARDSGAPRDWVAALPSIVRRRSASGAQVAPQGANRCLDMVVNDSRLEDDTRPVIPHLRLAMSKPGEPFAHMVEKSPSDRCACARGRRPGKALDCAPQQWSPLDPVPDGVA